MNAKYKYLMENLEIELDDNSLLSNLFGINDSNLQIIEKINDLPRINASKADLKNHSERINEIEKKYSIKTLWSKF